eukprot:TRINITY_DN22565_c0_g1_i1.p1 TRINITY_DN22565_c0_g1~~TRINITY_DN22565_c0_g1_i1.p1  ORF type:complete len:165 (+),score=7.24 TRINITY_DN22565_c0_g1_i1:244-738(+)
MHPRMVAFMEETKEEPLHIIELTKSFDATVQWCFTNGLLCSNPRCPKCQSDMVLIKDNNKIDLHVWSCSRKYSHGCRSTLTMRHGSFFADSKLTIPELVRLMFHFFIGGYSLDDTVKNTGLAKTTVVRQFHKLKTVFFIEGFFNFLFTIYLHLWCQRKRLNTEQ